MLYAIYLRKSRADLEAEAMGQGETLARHRAALLDYAAHHGLEIGAVYEEIISGESCGRWSRATGREYSAWI